MSGFEVWSLGFVACRGRLRIHCHVLGSSFYFRTYGGLRVQEFGKWDAQFGVCLIQKGDAWP